MIRINDPAQTLERVTERLQIAVRLLAEDERAAISPRLIQLQRRRVTALRATLTRVCRMLAHD